MIQILSKTLRPLGLMLLCIATAMPAFAQLPTLPKSDGSYVISSDADYETFCKMVSTGNPYANAVLTADITVKTSIGSGDEQFHYRGTFDGQEHTIILSNFAEQGLFANTQPGCVIRNLHVAGTLNTDAAVAGSIVAKATGVTLENCISSVTVSAPKSEFCGGLIGQAEGECFLENCAFIGTLEARQTVCGLVGNNVQMLSVKSCYAAPQYAGSATTGALFTNRIVVFQENGVTEYQTFLNNYYCGTSLSIGTPGIATETTQDQLNNGQLCYLLNQNGRKGVVWFQHGDYPFPFQGDGGQLVTCENDQFVTGNACSHESYVNHVCPKCGALEEGAKLDPLQYCTTTTHTDNSYYVGNLRYTLDLNNHTATVTGVRNRDVVNAIHIPETIRVNGEDYTVTSVTEPGFLKSVMEYCFVPKTVKLLGDNSFHECGKLKYLHIADCPSEGEKREDKLYMSLNTNDTPDEELFHYCGNLQKVYIGRDMRWDTSSRPTGPDEPFEVRHSITDVFFGPCVSRVGNYLEEDARAGYSYDLFNDCEGIRRVYIMGDDASLENRPMMFYSRDGLAVATDYYINRNIGYTNYWEYSVNRTDMMGCLDYCERVTYGPFVRFLTDRSFCATAATNNHILKYVDFTNAYRLEEIGNNAFNECPDAKFTGLNGQYPLKKICHDAFYNCDNLETFDFGSEIEMIESKAFNDCDNLKVLVIPASLSTLKEKAFQDCENLQAVMFEDSEYSINFSTLSSNFDGCKKLATLHINREILYDQLNEDNNSPFSSASSTLTHVVIGPRVTMVGGGLLLGLDALSSVTFEYSPKPLRFLRTPGADLYTAKGKGLTALQINRRLVDNDGYDLIGPQWGEKISSHVAEITFGDQITSLRDRAFEGFTGLKVLILPPTMQSVGERAFYGAKSLNTLVFQGPIAVGKEAFAECAGLENMVIANGQFKVGEAAFANCDSIQEITFNSNGDTPAGTADVFSAEAYANTALYSTYDTNIRWVDFNNLPWSKFCHRPFRRSNDYIGEEAPSGIYEHASIPHTVSKGQVEVMYFPFQWDSYYFGANAEVYVMHNNDFAFTSTSNKLDDILTTEGKKYDQTAYDTKMRRVDLLAHKLLSAGVYAVKTDFPATELHSMSNLYVANGVEVNNTTHWEESGKVALFFGGICGDTEPDGYGGDYVFEDGVLKLMNGKSVLQNGAVVISATDNDANHFVLNISNEADELLLTSRTPVPFHGALEGYATFYNEKFNVKAPSWCTVYVVTSAAGGSVHLEEITDRVIDAGQAVILKTKNPKAIGAEDLVTYATNGSERGAALYKQNLLKGVAVDTPVADLCGSADHIYVLSCNASLTNTGFYKYSTGKTLGAGKAYLPSTASSAEAKNCLFSLSDLETSIHHAADRSASQQMYDLSGRRVVRRSADQKGIFIINNQKIVK